MINSSLDNSYFLHYTGECDEKKLNFMDFPRYAIMRDPPEKIFLQNTCFEIIPTFTLDVYLYVIIEA